ncbi:LysR substrate-binding domain-containing protein [Croceicoccus mobilis]|uniref:Transcriptional regulator GcvA n=1 Tax=Croceicoccus mobilis TaxID=1703339 RepID=A0A916YQV6_9SPHN|nr:LysR substrate-binding domain-containing protein [Croceicoccus mobilis]GGD55695.1 transcriptional regulator GcvA [Croceicoccus mobilis]
MATRRLPPLRSLEAFVRIVRLGSAKAAAAELALSPSALSRRVSALEDYTGRKLFNRGHQTMKLTEDGQALFDAVAPALDELAEQVGRQMADNKVMRLRLNVLPLFGEQRLVPRLPELRQLYPALHIDIDSSPNPMARLGETLDAAIVITDEPDIKLHAVRLDHNMVHAIASRDLVNKLGNIPDPERLEKLNFLVHSDMDLSFDAWREATGMDLSKEPTVDHFDSGALILEAAAQGLGIAIMHGDHLARAKDERLAKLYDLEVESPYSYWFVCRPKALETRPVRIFHDWLMSAKL